MAHNDAKVAEAVASWELMREARQDLYNKHQEEMVPFQTAVENAQRDMIAELSKRFRVMPNRIVLGGHLCTESPTGQCIYDNIEDPWHDDCLACHDPAERK